MATWGGKAQILPCLKLEGNSQGKGNLKERGERGGEDPSYSPDGRFGKEKSRTPCRCGSCKHLAGRTDFKKKERGKRGKTAR